MSVFFTSRKTGFKSWLNTSSIPPRHLAICWDSSAVSYRFPDSFSIPGGLIEKALASSIASRHLVNRSSFCSWIWWVVPRYLLDTSAIDDLFLIPPSIASLIPLDTCIYRALLRVYIFISSRSDSHFFNLSQFVHIYLSPKHHLSHSKPLPLCFFKIFLLLVSF